MESFEDLGLGPELVEALSSEGMEEPTPFQAAAIPVIRRGNNLLGRAGPGAGTLVAYGAALLDRLEAGSATPRALVVTPSSESARALAEALAGLAGATGHVVAAAGSPWALPQRADILFGTATELLAWAQSNRFDPHAIDALVVDQAAAIQRTGGLSEVEALLAFLPKEGQRVILALPVGPEIEDFVERHARRAVQVPPKAVEVAKDAPQRGEVRYRIVEDPKPAGALQLVSELLEGDARHCCLFFATEDGAADVGDYLTLHGFAAGAPGDAALPVWLAVEDLAARSAEQEGVVAVSYDVPAGADSLDRRHGGGRGGVVVVLPREVAHMRDVAKATGYKVVPFPPDAPTSGRGELDRLIGRLEAAASDGDLAPYLVALEPLFARRGAAEVAAAAVALLRAGGVQGAPAVAGTAPKAAAKPAAAAKNASATKPSAHAAQRSAPAHAPAAPAAFERLYVSIGERDNVGPGDIVGAVAGESGISGSQIGRIEIRDTFSIVEVQQGLGEQVIRALNGVTVRGRSVRVDYDRGRASGGRDERGPRGSGGAARPKRDDRGERPARMERREGGPRDRAPRTERREGGARDRPARGGERRESGPRDRPARGGERREGGARERGPARGGERTPTRRGSKGTDRGPASGPGRGRPRDEGGGRKGPPRGGGRGGPPRKGGRPPRDDSR